MAVLGQVLGPLAGFESDGGRFCAIAFEMFIAPQTSPEFVKQVFLVIWVIGPASALIGYVLAWSIGIGDKATNLIASGCYFAGCITEAVVLFSRSLKDGKK